MFIWKCDSTEETFFFIDDKDAKVKVVTKELAGKVVL